MAVFNPVLLLEVFAMEGTDGDNLVYIRGKCAVVIDGVLVARPPNLFADCAYSLWIGTAEVYQYIPPCPRLKLTDPALLIGRTATGYGVVIQHNFMAYAVPIVAHGMQSQLRSTETSTSTVPVDVGVCCPERGAIVTQQVDFHFRYPLMKSLNTDTV
jgi:hypothetical protein